MKNVLKNRLAILLALALIVSIVPGLNGEAAAKEYTLKDGVMTMKSSEKIMYNTWSYFTADYYDNLIKKTNKVKTIKLSKNMKTVYGAISFGDYNKLEKISVPGSNKYFTSKSGVLYKKNEKTLVYYPENKKGASYTIGSKVTTIGYSAFDYPKNLTKIVVPKSVKKLSDHAFTVNNGKNVTIVFKGDAPKFDTKLGGPFYGSEQLTIEYPEKYKDSWEAFKANIEDKFDGYTYVDNWVAY